MRIGLFSDTYTPHANGVAVCVETLKKGLEKEGHEVFVITCNDKLYVEREGNVLKLPSVVFKKLYGYSVTTPVQITGFSEVRDLKLDIIHVHTEFGIALFGRFMARYLKLPLIYTYHTMFEDYTHYINVFNLKLLDKPSLKLVEYISKVYCEPSNVVIVPSRKTYDVLNKYGVKTKMEILPSGIDLERFKNVDINEVNEIKKELGLENKKVMIYLGRIAKEKNIEIVLNAFNKIKDVSLILVGLGPELDILKEQYESDNIKFLGKKEYIDVPKYYSLADGFISASTSETQGLTFIEAMATGKPLFCTDRVVLDGLLIENENGYFFDSEDDLVDRINRYYSLTDEERNSMSKKSIDISMKYDLGKFINKVLSIYEENLGKIYRIEYIKYKKNGLAKIKIKGKRYWLKNYEPLMLGLKENEKIDQKTLNYIRDNNI
ncbi:glycosyltransferase [Pseudostreptobacillus hongkongensis]|uniref:glycosyltransferase n=1 Tax=Pseudostreptobacillus hongkongensis TaxID=1162717 RepID=UPI00082D2A3F|nr:glycosyltransferase [Pseudostreptobacillus hongkongensis]